MEIQTMRDRLPEMRNNLGMAKEEWELFLPTYEYVLEKVHEIPCNEAQEQLYRRMCAFMWHAGKIYQEVTNGL